jgi:hypothetical protein
MLTRTVPHEIDLGTKDIEVIIRPPGYVADRLRLAAG